MSPSGGRKVAFAPECKTNNEVATALWSCRHLRFQKLPRSGTAELLAVRGHREDGLDAGHIEFLAAIVAIYSVLLLLDIGQLGVAEASDVIGHRNHSLDLSLKPLVEVLHRNHALAVAP